MVPFLIIILITVPLRVGFDFEVPAFSAWFWIDVVLDLYFALDIAVNFRTAFSNENGQIETDQVRHSRPAHPALCEEEANAINCGDADTSRPCSQKLIAKNYMRGWFVVDTLSCLPVQYVMLLVNSLKGGPASGGGGSIKITKILRCDSSTLRKRTSCSKTVPFFRLIKLAKNMARLGRLKKISVSVPNHPLPSKPSPIALQCKVLMRYPGLRSQELKKKYEDYLEPILTTLNFAILFLVRS